MFIKYNKVNLHALATYDGKQLAHLRPGWNEFPNHIWEQNKNDTEILRMIEEGDIEVMEEKIVEKVGKKTIVKIVGQTDGPVMLKDFDEKKAVDVVNDTYNVDLLQRWMDEESRHKVKRALDKKLKAIHEKGKPSTEEAS